MDQLMVVCAAAALVGTAVNHVDAIGNSKLGNPNLNIRPLPINHGEEPIRIWVNTENWRETKHWVDSLDKFIEPYDGSNPSQFLNYIHCSENVPALEGQVCNFQDIYLGANCQISEYWSYPYNSPCVIFKMDKIPDWTPDVYTTIEELPSDMPQDLRDHIIAVTGYYGGLPKRVWMSCKGATPDDENYIGEIEYTPWRGFPAYYFPYRNIPEYLSPIVAVRFVSPAVDVLITVECKAYANNIVHSRADGNGVIQFELLLSATNLPPTTTNAPDRNLPLLITGIACGIFMFFTTAFFLVAR